MSVYFKALGALIFVASLFGAFKVHGILDVAALSKGNQMLSAMLTSPGLVEQTEQMRFWSSLYMMLIGLGLGSLCFGVGELLRRR